MSEFQLPPSRPLPPEVRGRLRARVMTGVRPQRRTRYFNSRAPFAVAAGVAMLVAGAMIIGQSVTGGPGRGSTPPTGTSSTTAPLDLSRANSELDRCWAAIQAEGKAAQYPDRARWRAVSSGEYQWVWVTAAFADGSPIFCQTSRTTVRVSAPAANPAYASGSRTAALLITPEGTIAGVADPSWQGVGVFVNHGDAGGGTQGRLLTHGLFVAVSSERTDESASYQVDPWVQDSDRASHPERWTLPKPAAPVSRVDRPAPAADRTSERGQWLKQCLENSETPVVDADMWEPGAWITLDETRLLVIRSGRTFGYCYKSTVSTVDFSGTLTRWGFGVSVIGVSDFATRRPMRLPGLGTSLGTKGKPEEFLTGALPDGVTRVEIAQPDLPPIQADVANSTFAAWVHLSSGPSDIVRAFDGAGNKVFEGSLF